MLCQSQIDFDCLHFRHDGNPQFAARSAEFCRQLCLGEKVELKVENVRGKELVQKGDLSWEAACRALRYRYIREHGSGLYLTGHTADDQAETLLLRLLAGSGLAGMSGVRRHRSDGVFRPLLDFRRSELREFLKASSYPWLDDPSNVEGNRRAQLRSQVLPLLEEFEPSLVPALCRSAEILAEDEEALTRIAQDWLFSQKELDHWPLDSLKELPKAIRYRVFRELWRRVSGGARRPLGAVFTSMETLVQEGNDNRAVFINSAWRFRRLGRSMWLEPVLGSPWKRLNLLEGERVGDFLAVGEPRLGTAVPESWNGKKLFLKSREPGDRCLGKDLKKLLASTGQPPWVRDRWPLITDGETILAVLGLGRQPWGTEVLKGPHANVCFAPENLRWPAFGPAGAKGLK